MKITINEPCHENWDAMTPNKQGAFCKSCVKDVVDFSKMSVGQIKDFFSKPQSDKICGRFEEKQLQELTFDDFFAKFTYWNFAKKFAVIFFMAFGFWVFSNSSAVAQNNDRHLKGEVAYFEPKPLKKDTVKKTMGQPVIKAEPKLMGKIKCTTPPPTHKIIKEKNPPMIMGDFAVPVEEKQPEIKMEKGNVTVVKCLPEIHEDSIIKKQPPIKNVIEEHLVMGLIAMPRIEKIEPVKVTPVIKVDSIAATQKIIDTENLINIYPNPGNGIFILETNLKHTIHILDENGKIVLVKNISGTTTIDASNLTPGIYTVDITNEKATIRKKILVVK